jgi:hypothetical protein
LTKRTDAKTVRSRIVTCAAVQIGGQTRIDLLPARMNEFMGRRLKRPFSYLHLWVALSVFATMHLSILAINIYAQPPTPPIASPTPSATTPDGATSPPTLAPTVAATATVTATNVGAIGATASVSQTAQPAGATTLAQAVTLPTPTPAAASPLAPATSTPVAAAGPLQGTIIANRSDDSARFFVEGATYEVAAGSSRGIDIPRASSVLNLFNCPASTPESTPGCFWDPYLVEQDGFYEIYPSPATGSVTTLLLRAAGSPPTNQVWVQNRTEETETLVFRGEVQEIAPAAVVEFSVPTGVPAILYVRSCITLNGQSVCEWAPKTLDAGIYYAMVRLDTAGTEAGSRVTLIDLRPVIAGVVAEAAESAESAVLPPASGPSIACRLLVPALNIRSGPGLQYDIIGKVRSEGTEPMEIAVTGRSADNEWMTVDPAVITGGWINNNANFVTCMGNVSSLPIAEAPATPAPPVAVVPDSPATSATDPTALAPVAPQPESAEAAPPATAEATPEVTVEATPEPVDDGSAIPLGQSLLVINNGFEHEMRFTIDQSYRPDDGPSEYDLQPGASVTLVVYPGNVAFTASSAWNGLSQNAELFVERDQALTLWLRFERDAGGSWQFKFD